MATPPDCFGAHDRDRAGARSNVEQSLDWFLELLRLHVVAVPAERSVAPGGVARVCLGFSFAAQFTKMFVTNSVRDQRFRQRVPIELRIPLRAWPCAHVGQHSDLIFLEQRNEFVDRPCGVAHGPDSHHSSKRRRFTTSGQITRAPSYELCRGLRLSDPIAKRL